MTTHRINAPSDAPSRTRSADRTRAAILVAARVQFARDGADRTTIRSIATEVGVDPALIIRYFGNKANLFARAADLTLALPDLTDLGPEEMAGALVDRFFEVWEQDGTFLALMRAAASSETVAARMLEVFTHQAEAALAGGAVDQPGRRAALVGSQVLGFAFSRYILKTPELVRMTRDEVFQWLGPALARYLTDPDPGRFTPARPQPPPAAG